MVDLNIEIQNLVEQIVTNYQPEKIILFGSCIKCTNNSPNDIDLLIIKETEKRLIDRIHEVHRPLDYNIPIDLLVYTPQEMELYMNDNTSFISQIVKEGKILYEH